MKKLIFAALMTIYFINFSSAQTTPTQARPEKKVKTAKTVTPVPPAPSTKTAVKPTATPTPTAAPNVVMKKDGTPDKRYTKMTKTPLKKDGTPDKRFKANKKP